jgi:hypothetical protein
MASEIKVNKISPESGTTLTLGDSGDTINFGSGVLPNFENLTVTGDLTVDTNSLKVDSTNNFVGIGTASPSVALDVVGAITASGNITGTLATAAQPNITSVGTLTGLTVSGNIAGTLTTAAQTNITSVGTLTSFASTGIDDNATSTAVTIDSSGDVGINNTAPNLNSFNKAVTLSGTNNAGYELAKGSTLHGALALQGDNRVQLINFQNADITFNTGTSATERMRINSTGVGIGTSSPSARLSVDSGSTGLNSNFNSSNANGAYVRFQNSGTSIGDIGAGANVVSGGTAGDFAIASRSGNLDFGTGSVRRMRIDSSGRLLINTTSYLQDSDEKLSVNGIGTFQRAGNTAIFNRTGSDGDAIRIEKDGTTVGVIGTQNWGIGTTSPSTKLQVTTGSSGVTPHASADELFIENSSGNSAGLTIASGASDSGRLAFADTGSSLIGLLAYDHSSNSMQFTTNGSEAMRIDSSGNVLVGKTTANTGAAGVEAIPLGRISATRSGNITALFNRLSSDGEVVRFQKDGTTSGQINISGSRMNIGSSNTGIRFDSNSRLILPWDVSTNSATGVDAQISLGTAGGFRFKDLYLGGGLYVGGTGTANKLDDYEEGTWTPAWNATGTAPTVTHSAQNGTYTKVGRLVTVKCQVQTNSSGISGGSGDLSITGLPFTSSNESDNGTAAISFVSFISLNSNYTTFGIEAFRNTTYFRWVQYGSNNSGLTVPVGNASSSNSVNVGFTATYYTA